MNTQDIISLFEKHVIPNYTRFPVAVVRGEGSWVWDAEGKKYLDLFPGWGANGLGHCHPRVVEAIREQAGRLMHVPNTFYMEEQGRLAETMGRLSGMDGRCFFSNSGAEANEGALKLARLHCEGRTKIVSCIDSFHGRTFAAISATGQPKYREGFMPTVPGFEHVPFNDLEAMRAAVDEETCAVIVEPVQGEGGVNVADREYLEGLRALCDKKGVVLIFDEVQTSPGRLGEYFGYQHFGVEPDVMTTAKAVAGGFPFGAMMVRPEFAPSLRPGTHASTFGGNPLGCAASQAVFDALEHDGVLENIRAASDHLGERLAALAESHPVVAGVRRCGLMIGIELNVPGAGIVRHAMEQGVLVNVTHETILRMLPAFTVTTDEIDRGLDILDHCLREEPAGDDA